MFVNSVFAIVTCPVDAFICGQTGQTEVDSWRKGTQKALCIEFPMRLMVSAERGEQGPFQIHIIPFSFIDTPQREVYVEPYAVEVVGAIEQDACTDGKMLYQAYQSAVQQRKAKLSGIALPSPDQVGAALKTPFQDPKKTNVTPFHPRGR